MEVDVEKRSERRDRPPQTRRWEKGRKAGDGGLSKKRSDAHVDLAIGRDLVIFH